ncbi:MAG: crossover junction endodeoxyribonuclease RuvC [Candidatus Omnitrophota bacterium]|jgi:crossover junction endodeoxyribonuclease RuvC
MRILGVDPGLRVCGYGVIEKNNYTLKLIEAGIITTNSSEDIARRLNEIYGSLAGLIKEAKPEVLVLEKIYAHSRHPATAFLLGHARGVICLLCAQYNIKLFEYLPTRVKKAIVGRGHASKIQIKKMIEQLLSIKKSAYAFDVSDALSLAIAYTQINKTDDYRDRRKISP